MSEYPELEIAPLTDDEADAFWFAVPPANDHVAFRYTASLALQEGWGGLPETEDAHLLRDWFQGTWSV